MKSSSSLRRHRWLAVPLLTALVWPARAHASFLHGETLDAAANVLAWVVLVIAPVVGIAVFWLVHILPEKIAEKKKHPQTHAIQTLCLLSLVFGGMLWPLAWLWAYTKPVFYKTAYGSDTDETIGHGKKGPEDDEAELKKARARVAELESKAATSRSEKGKA